MKRSVSLLLTLVMIIGIFVSMPVTVFAASSGNCGNNVRWSLSNNGVLTISGSGAMWDYNIWGDDETAFHPSYSSSEISEIIISSGVTRIGNEAFYGCTNLTSITIPNSITSIGDYAFYYCTSLTSITIPDSVASIGKSAFYNCKSLNSIIIPDSVTSIGDSAFYNCTSLNKTYFEGTENKWGNINIGTHNDNLFKDIVYGYKAPETPFTKAVNTVNSITITWNNVDNATKYNIYRRREFTSTWVYLGTTTGTSFVDENIESNCSYAYSVRAYAANGLYSEYNSYNSAIILHVNTPTVITTNTIDGIQIKWNHVLSTGYKIYRRVGGSSNWLLIGTTSESSFIDKNVENGTYYVYSVRAINGTGYSIYDYTEYISAFDANKTDTIQPITAPTAVATNLTNGVQIKWNASIGATKYNVYRRIGGSSSWVLVGTTTGTSIVDKGVTNGKYYVYSVRAINGTGYSAFDTQKTDTIQPITAPTTKVANKSNGVQVSWNKVTGATKYNVYRRLGGTSTWIYVGTTTGTSFLDKGAVKGKSYAYSIRAINGTGYSAYNSSKCAAIKHR